jgi:hypothetical protein
MQERVQRRVRYDPHVTAAPSVTARRSAARDKLLAPESSHAVAAVAAFYPNLYAINEHPYAVTVIKESDDTLNLKFEI